MKIIDFTQGDDGLEKHDCIGIQVDDWLIFSCPTCDYIRKFNWKTREMKVKGGDMFTLHNGFHIPFQSSPSNDFDHN